MTEPLNLSDPENVNALYRRAIDQLGRESQADAIIEEAAELIFAVCKQKRAESLGVMSGKTLDAVAEEIADMEIALAQAKLIYFGSSPEAAGAFEAVKRRKLEKLIAKLDVQ